MANGLYGSVVPAANTLTKLTDTAVPAGKIRTVSIGACSTGGVSAKIWIAYSTATDASGVPANKWKSANVPLADGADYERTHQILGPSEHVYVKANVEGVHFDCRGYEGSAA